MSLPQLIFVTTGGGILFQAGVLFSKENAKFWPILASLGNFVANLRTVWRDFTGPKRAVVYPN